MPLRRVLLIRRKREKPRQLPWQLFGKRLRAMVPFRHRALNPPARNKANPRFQRAR